MLFSQSSGLRIPPPFSQQAFGRRDNQKACSGFLPTFLLGVDIGGKNAITLREWIGAFLRHSFFPE
jgi:hypothetical protein